MKKIIMVALMGLGMVMSLVSCEKVDVDDLVGYPTGDNFKVETFTKFSHKFPHRGNVPLVIEEEQFMVAKDGGSGIITTNYGEIPMRFPYVKGLKVSTRMVEDELNFDEFFLQGGYIIISFSAGGHYIKADSIRFDIIATQDQIDEWSRRMHKK